MLSKNKEIFFQIDIVSAQRPDMIPNPALRAAGEPDIKFGSVALLPYMAIHRSKRYRAAAEKIKAAHPYPFAEALATLKTLPATKFDQTVTISFRLGVDPRQSDQMVRGTCPLPNGSGKSVRVLVFAEGASADAAREAGAE